MAYEGLAPPTGINWGNAGKTYGQVRFGEDNQQVVLFYIRSVFNAAKSAAMGSRQYESQTWVKMHPPGEKLNIIDRPVEDNDKRRYPHQWNLFLQNKTQVPDGTPIDLLFPNSPHVADNLKAYSVYTIQQCANLSDNAIQTIGMGATEWKNMATQYLQSASSGTEFLKVKDELRKKDQEIRVMNRKFDQLKAAYDDLAAKFGGPNQGQSGNGQWPPPVEPVDTEVQTLNANHPSQQMRPSGKKVKPAPPREEIEQANIFKQVTEESFPVVDVTKDQEIDFGLVGAKKVK